MVSKPKYLARGNVAKRTQYSSAELKIEEACRRMEMGALGDMAKALYLVIDSRGEWWVDFEGKAHGPFTSRENAALEARSLARFQAHTGRHSEVLGRRARQQWVVVELDHLGEGRSFTPHRVSA